MSITRSFRGRKRQVNSDPALAQQMTWQALADLRHQKSTSLAYFDDFWLFATLQSLAESRSSTDFTSNQDDGI